MIKFFRKKKDRKPESNPPPKQPVSESSFYSHHVPETPLDEYYTGVNLRQTHRTSRHSPARVRETSNRASSGAIAWLLTKAVLIVILLAGGYFGLKWWLDGMAKPTEKELQRAEAKAALMDKKAAPSTFAGAPVQREIVVNPALIEQRVEQWEQTDRHLRSAEALARRGIDEEAALRLVQALRLTPESRAAQTMLADIYMRRGLYAEAVPLYIHLLDQEGRQQDLQMNLLRALHASGQIDTGLVLANRILQDQPNNLTVLSIAAAGQLEKGEKEAALALFGRILENDAKNISALEYCGKIYFGSGEWEKAIPYYLELVRLGPKPDYYQMLARCYAQQDEAGKAVIFMGQAASLFGEATVSPWLRESGFDPVRETVDFRAFADRIVGIETRKAIESINKREAEKATSTQMGADGSENSAQPELLKARRVNLPK